SFVCADLRCDAADQLVSEAGNVFEYLSERNVGASSATEITLTPPPDLVVSQMIGPSDAASGTTIGVRWTVRNGGFTPTRAAAAWTDNLYLSADSLLDGTDVLLNSMSHPGVLGAGAGYSSPESVPLPHRASV